VSSHLAHTRAIGAHTGGDTGNDRPTKVCSEKVVKHNENPGTGLSVAPKNNNAAAAPAALGSVAVQLYCYA